MLTVTIPLKLEQVQGLRGHDRLSSMKQIEGDSFDRKEKGETFCSYFIVKKLEKFMSDCGKLLSC